MKKVVFLTTLCLALTIGIFGQAKEITSDEYSKQERAASEKINAISWRSSYKKETYENGKLSGTTENIIEYQPQDKWRWLTVEKNGAVTKRTEVIQIGKVYYCRRDALAWETSDTYCGEPGKFNPARMLNDKFTVEETKLDGRKSKLFEKYRRFNVGSESQVIVRYWQDRFWIDEDGFFLRREGQEGLEEPKDVGSKWFITYEYNPKDLKIVAPIIGTPKKS